MFFATILATMVAATATWWVFMDSGYGIRAFLEGARGSARGVEIAAVDVLVLQTIRRYFLLVYGSEEDSSHKLARFRFDLAVAMLPLDVLMFTAILLHNNGLVHLGAVLLSLSAVAYLVLWFFQTHRKGIRWKSRKRLRRELLIRFTQPFGGPAVFARTMRTYTVGKPPNYLDGIRVWWMVRIASVVFVPVAAAGFVAWAFDGGFPMSSRLWASLALFVYCLAELPLLFDAWVSKQPWPGNTPLETYYPLWAMREDMRDEGWLG